MTEPTNDAGEPARQMRWHHDTAATHLIRTPNDVLTAINKLEVVGVEMQWRLECLWLGDPKDMCDYHAVLHGVLRGPIITEYMRRRYTGKGTVPRMNDLYVHMLTVEQVDAVVEAAKAVQDRTE